jgi:hypothetical protein
LILDVKGKSQSTAATGMADRNQYKNMPQNPFDPAAFYKWYFTLSIEGMQKAWDALKPAEQKLCNEWTTFIEFAEAAHLDVDLQSIEMLDPNAVNPPPFPDIRCVSGGKPAYFELGETVDETLAKAAGIARKNQEDVYGGFVDPPHVSVERMIAQKCGKSYTTNGCPLDLVLYFSRLFPIESLLNGYLEQSRGRLIQYIQQSQFNSVWIYDKWQKRVLAKLER